MVFRVFFSRFSHSLSELSSSDSNRRPFTHRTECSQWNTTSPTAVSDCVIATGFSSTNYYIFDVVVFFTLFFSHSSPFRCFLVLFSACLCSSAVLTSVWTRTAVNGTVHSSPFQPSLCCCCFFFQFMGKLDISFAVAYTTLIHSHRCRP